MTEAAPTPPEPFTTEVSPGVHAYVQLDGSWGLNNAAFLVGEDTVTLVDTCFTERRTRALLAEVERVAGPDRPVTTLVNTHHHGDHTHGNWLVEGATIIGHDRCRSEVVASGLISESLFPGVDWGAVEILPPQVTFSDSATVFVDDLRVELVHLGPAHTTNDVVAWIPDRGVLLAGDLVFAGGTPFVVMGSVAGSITAVEALIGLGAETIVPGHGAVCGPEALDDQLAYLRFVQDLADAALEGDLPPLDAAGAPTSVPSPPGPTPSASWPTSTGRWPRPVAWSPGASSTSSPPSATCSPSTAAPSAPGPEPTGTAGQGTKVPSRIRAVKPLRAAPEAIRAERSTRGGRSRVARASSRGKAARP